MIPVIYDQVKFKLDADVRRCWAPIGSKPIVYKNGSKKSINIGGSYALTGEFHYYKMFYQVKEEVLWNIKLLRMKFPKMLFLMDRATWNNNHMVKGYLERMNIPYMLLPPGSSDLSATEECWRQTRKDITTNYSFNSEKELFKALKSYWDERPFKHNMLNYLDY